MLSVCFLLPARRSNRVGGDRVDEDAFGNIQTIGDVIEIVVVAHVEH